MDPKEIKELVAAEVVAATAPLQKEIESLKEQLSNASAAVAAETKEPKKFVTPDDKIKAGKDLTVQFTAPTFVFEKKIYVSEAEVKNTALIEKLVKQQTVDGKFKDGLLKQVS